MSVSKYNMDGVDISQLLNKPDNSTCNEKPFVHTVKSTIILFLLFLFVMSDMFVHNVISKINEKYVDGRHPTLKGIYIQGMLLVLMFVILQYLVEHDYL